MNLSILTITNKNRKLGVKRMAKKQRLTDQALKQDLLKIKKASKHSVITVSSKNVKASADR